MTRNEPVSDDLNVAVAFLALGWMALIPGLFALSSGNFVVFVASLGPTSAAWFYMNVRLKRWLKK